LILIVIYGNIALVCLEDQIKCLIKCVIEVKIKWKRRSGWRRKQPLDDVKEQRRY